MLLKLLECVLTCNDFEFNEEFFLQNFGTAIGTKVALSYANLVVSILEALYVYVYGHQPSCWLRFIDDVFGIWAGDMRSLQTFVQYLNERVESLKFTLEYSTTNLSFLDVMVIKDKPGNISTDLFRKPTDDRNYLHYSSAHLKSCKHGIPYSQFLRVRRICSDVKQFEHNAIEMARSFIIRGYPPGLIEAAIIRARRQNRDDLLKPRDKPETIENRLESVLLITRYTLGPYVLSNIVQKNVPYLTKNAQYRDLHSLEIFKEFFVGHLI